MMSTEDGMRKAFENLDEAAGAAPTSDTVFGDKTDKRKHSPDDAQDAEDDTQSADDE